MDLQTRNQYMKAMGIPIWLPKPEAADCETSPPPLKQPAAEMLAVNKEPGENLAPTELRTKQQPLIPVAEPAKPTGTAIAAPDCSQMDWPALRNSVVNCQLCTLHKSRTQTVFGTGDTQADWMIVGEAPGANEDRQGEPFVGKAGQLLNNMLAAVGLPRNAVYISNVLKCRPPNNRDPKPEESALCRGYLERQIALIQPKLIIVVGRIAAHNLLQVTTPLGRLRGKLHQLPGSDIPVLVTYHPAYLLRQPLEKRKAWQDLQLARQAMHKR